MPSLSCTSMTSSAPPPWTNQPLVLYHGTLDIHVAAILTAVDPLRGRRDADFGIGFYTTTLEEQAFRWAERLAWHRVGVSPAVIRFEVDRDIFASLDCLWFVRGSRDATDFWSFVTHCRTGGSQHGRRAPGGWYDVVIGPVAASWRRRLAQPRSDQVSFHTERAAHLLDASTSWRVL